MSRWTSAPASASSTPASAVGSPVGVVYGTGYYNTYGLYDPWYYSPYYNYGPYYPAWGYGPIVWLGLGLGLLRLLLQWRRLAHVLPTVSRRRCPTRLTRRSRGIAPGMGRSRPIVRGAPRGYTATNTVAGQLPGIGVQQHASFRDRTWAGHGRRRVGWHVGREAERRAGVEDD